MPPARTLKAAEPSDWVIKMAGVAVPVTDFKTKLVMEPTKEAPEMVKALALVAVKKKGPIVVVAL